MKINTSENILDRNRINERFENNIEDKLRFLHRFFRRRIFVLYLTIKFFSLLLPPYYFAVLLFNDFNWNIFLARTIEVRSTRDCS